jgi:hypothetical protein
MTSRIDSPERLWRNTFDKQLTDEMMERVLKQTMLLVRKIERKTPWRDQQTADDRLHTAIVKTLDRTLAWDPERVDLERHFLGAIAGDLSHELEHAVEFPHVSLDDKKRGTAALKAETSEAIAASRAVKDEVPTAAFWADVMSELRKHAGEDRQVLAILDAYEHGKLVRRDVMAHTGLSSKQYPRRISA